MILTAASLALTAAATAAPVASPNPEWDADWPARESWCLTDHVQLTSEHDFLKAGESYFSPDAAMIIFQGTPRPTGGAEPDKYYDMYVAPVVRDASGAITGLGTPLRVSRPGSSNTCGWFHPTDFGPDHYRVLFGSTTTPPSEEGVAGYQRGTSRYSWQFPSEMEIVTGSVGVIHATGKASAEVTLFGLHAGSSKAIDSRTPTPPDLHPLWTRDGYDAEGSWSPDGRFIVYTRLAPGGDDGDLWIYDTTTDRHTELVAQPGYDGGPFFSPDGKRICYRSDRRGDKALQLFVSDLAFDDTGAVTGVSREAPITDNEHVNWAPFFTPDGTTLFYATSEVSHANYEVFAVDITGDAGPADRARVRITDARGFDGLPVFTPDGSWMMWTAQRGAQVEGEDRPSSQLWAARVDLAAVKKRLEAEKRRIEDRKLDEGFDEYTPGS